MRARGRAASHQQRQAEEAPSRQQLGGGRRHLGSRQQQQQQRPLPAEAGIFNGGGRRAAMETDPNNCRGETSCAWDRFRFSWRLSRGVCLCVCPSFPFPGRAALGRRELLLTGQRERKKGG